MAKTAKKVKKAKKIVKKAQKTQKKIAQKVVTPIMPQGDRVLVRPLTDIEMGTKSPSGILIPDTAKEEKSDRGVVVAVGEGKMQENGKRTPLSLSVGDTILFQWGEKIEHKGDVYYIVREDNILATLAV